MTILLLHAGRLALDRGVAAETAEPICRRVAASLQEEILQGLPYDHLPAAGIGTAISFSLVDCLTARALAEGLEGGMLTTCVQLGLTQLKRRLNTPEGRPFEAGAEEFQALSTIIDTLQQHRLPALRHLGILGAPGKEA